MMHQVPYNKETAMDVKLTSLLAVILALSCPDNLKKSTPPYAASDFSGFVSSASYSRAPPFWILLLGPFSKIKPIASEKGGGV